jgi:AAA ATPase domain
LTAYNSLLRAVIRRQKGVQFMAIPGVSEDCFQSVIRDYLSASRPVSHHEHLMGRDDMLLKIQRAFSSNGRHIFIHGDRGIGKTSVARAASNFHQDVSLPTLSVQCEPRVNAYAIMRDIALKILPPKKTGLTRVVQRERLKVGLPGLSYEKAHELSQGTVPAITSINEAIVVVDALARAYAKPPVIIVDEFDQITGLDARRTVASFVKAVSEEEVPLRFIICGIGHSLDAMIGQHLSTGRLLAPLKLQAILPGARMKILKSAASQLGVEIDNDSLHRASAISDGFPYYIHLVGEHLFWQMHDDTDPVTVSSPRHFDGALLAAAEMAEPNLKVAYEKATQKYKNDYEEVLWSVADDSDLRRQVTDIYNKSYLRIMELRKKKPLAKTTFYSRMGMLSKTGNGSVLETTGAGWYQFRENRLRGYVRLVAERNGIKLDSEHHLGPSQKRFAGIAS